MVVWRAWNLEAAVASESRFRETVMSTMEPEEMSGGRRMEGNSIWTFVSLQLGVGGRLGAGSKQLRGPGTYEALVFC